MGAAIGYKTQKQANKAGPCGNPYCTCDTCACGAGCQCGRPVSMLAVSGSSSRRDFMDKAKNMFFGGLAAAAAGPEGTDLDSINHEDMINEEGEKVTSKFSKP